MKHQTSITAETNFETIWRSHLLLFRVLTLDEWRGLMYDCAVKAPHCSEDAGECGSPAAYVFFILFIVIAVFIVLHIIIAVILLNFKSVALEEGLSGLAFVSAAVHKSRRIHALCSDLQERFQKFKLVQSGVPSEMPSLQPMQSMQSMQLVPVPRSPEGGGGKDAVALPPLKLQGRERKNSSDDWLDAAEAAVLQDQEKLDQLLDSVDGAVWQSGYTDDIKEDPSAGPPVVVASVEQVREQ